MLQYFSIIALSLKAVDSMAVIFHVPDSYTLLLDSLGKYILECKIILEPIICYYIAEILLKSHQTYGCS